MAYTNTYFCRSCHFLYYGLYKYLFLPNIVVPFFAMAYTNTYFLTNRYSPFSLLWPIQILIFARVVISLLWPVQIPIFAKDSCPFLCNGLYKYQFCQTELSFSLLWSVQIPIKLSFSFPWPLQMPFFAK